MNDMHEQNSEAANGGYLGRAYRKYLPIQAEKTFEKAKKIVKTITGTSEAYAELYLNSAHGHHFFGRENDVEFLKQDFEDFCSEPD